MNLSASAGDARDVDLILRSGISPSGGNDSPLRYSRLGNPMDRTIVLGSLRRRTGLNNKMEVGHSREDQSWPEATDRPAEEEGLPRSPVLSSSCKPAANSKMLQLKAFVALPSGSLDNSCWNTYVDGWGGFSSK